MPRVASKLTERRLKALKVGEWVGDGDVKGLGARRHKGGVSFVMRYQWAGKRRVQVLGEWASVAAMLQRPATAFEARPRYSATETIERVQAGESVDNLLEVVIAGGTPLISLDEARALARELKRRASRGESPKADPKADWRKLTLAQALALYLDSGKARSPRTVEFYSESVDRYLAEWKPRALATLEPHEVYERHREIGEKHGRYAANGAMRSLRAIYNKARKLHPKLPANPVAAVDWYEEHRRDAAIPSDRLATWWTEVQALRNGVRRDYLMLVLFTGLRRETAESIRDEDIDLEARTLRVPKPKGGARRAFTVPLPDFLVELIRRRQEANESERQARNERRARKGQEALPPSPWLFPAFSASGHISEPKPSRGDGFSVGFTVHGLRNTYISAATAAGVHPYAIKLLTNHALPSGDVTAGYVSADVEALRPEQERVATRLLGLVEPQPANVVPLHRDAV